MRYKNLRTIFGEGPRAHYLQQVLEDALKTDPKAVRKDHGTHVIAAISRDPNDDEAVVTIKVDNPIRYDQDGSSRLMVMNATQSSLWRTKGGA